MMVGDGINDVQAMKKANVSLSFASSSCDKVKLHSDCSIFDDDMDRLPELIDLSHRSYDMIEQSITLSRIYNVAFGFLNFVLHFSPFTAKTIDTFNSLQVLLMNKRIEYISQKSKYDNINELQRKNT